MIFYKSLTLLIVYGKRIPASSAHFSAFSQAVGNNSASRSVQHISVHDFKKSPPNNYFLTQRKMSKASTNSGTIAVCQLTATNNKSENFNICKNLIESATDAGAKVVFLPEACDYVAENRAEAIELSEPLTGDLVTNYRELAKQLEVWLSLGGIHERIDGGKVQNTHVIIDSNGDLVSVYRKLHLFDVDIPERNIRLKESDYVKEGKEIVKPVSSPVGEIGLGICYDVRFPEMSAVLRNIGAQILTYPSAFTFATGALHWEVLLRSRAIENQCYVVAAAQTGSHNHKRTSWGHAMVVDPLGTIIAQCTEGTGFALSNIDLKALENARKTMPVITHKRNDVYPEMLPIFKIDEVENSLAKMDVESNSSKTSYQFGQVLISQACIFYQTNFTMAFVNKRCVVPGHVLIAPLRPALRLRDLMPDELADLFLVVQKVEEVMEHVHGARSTTVAVQDGPDAGRTINHFHVHILPRKKGDFLQNDQIYYELQEHDKSEDKPWRDEEDMNSEAAMLKKYFDKNLLYNHTDKC
ncbi:ntrilase and fragile histidine triad fusion protein NitFhit [Lycorma delicatula]|uniref:ntrilase and fragile histidine triad fusion protein NitFhit n=1 Tax=Lycorma delicatula TaxID=130591 RepID=UPI003F5112F0